MTGDTGDDGRGTRSAELGKLKLGRSLTTGQDGRWFPRIAASERHGYDSRPKDGRSRGMLACAPLSRTLELPVEGAAGACFHVTWV